MDVDRSGDVSNLEFINAIRKLNLGLNLKEIEDLIMYCDSNQDGKISFNEFIRKFAPQYYLSSKSLSYDFKRDRKQTF